jgi:hypothetical protein
MRSIHTTLILGALATAAVAAPVKDVVDPAALRALCKMSSFLREQNSFTIRTTTDTDYVTDDGQKLRLGGRDEIRVQRPDHLWAERKSDRKDRQFFYDGKTFTVYSPKLGYYSTMQAPDTIGELATVLQARYGLELPLVDLFRWGHGADFDDIEQASYIGAATIDGTTTDQYAFRQDGLDWQIWIQRGAQPLPRKLVLTTTDDPARPEHAVQISWQLNVDHANTKFAFVPPKGSNRIPIAERAPAPEIENTRSARR